MTMRLLKAALIFLVVLLPAAPAQAHAKLVRTNPAQGEILPVPPENVELVFSESVSPVKDKIRIVGPDGQRVDDGMPVVDGATVRIKLKDGTKTGTYLVSFRVISADSHPVPGAFTYSIGSPSATPVEVPQAESDDLVLWLLGIAKYIGYAGLALLVGAVFVLTMLWPRRLERRDPKRLMWLGMGLVAFSTAAALYLQAPYTSGGSLSDVEGFDDVMSSRFGIALLVRLAVLAVAAFLLRPLINGVGGPADRYLAIGLGVIGAVTWPLAGHPAGSPVPAVSIVVDAAHLGAVAVWLGGLTMLTLFVLRRADDEERRLILPVWSRWAGLAISVVLLAGVISALIEVGTPTALVDTTYGRYILIKLALVGLLIAAASQARRLLLSNTLRKIVVVELSIAAVILGVTAALTQTTPARTAEAIAQTPPPGPQQQLFTTTLDSPKFRLQVTVDQGENRELLVHLFAYTLDGQPQNVEEWKTTAALPSGGIEPLDVPTLKIPPNHATATIQLPTPGEWVFSFTLRTTEIDQDTVTATVPIK
ncbi:MAG TPA: copper resistance protein CopC [Candidatus Limnocylindrales bacterium]